MQIRGKTRTFRLAAIGVALLALGARASADQEMKLSTLEAKLNEALRNAAAAKVDAATAMLMAEEAQKKAR
ncbi:MAG: hypothetical protein VW338_08565 [Rhodospirillaceae bacterium]